jgi:hypothetical protein
MRVDNFSEVEKMKFEETAVEGAIAEIRPLEHVMNKAGLIRGEHWDYERVTYDYKMETPVKNETYYLRIQGIALEGDVDRGNAVIKLFAPILGKHYYPHGIEYDEEFPNHIVEKCNKIIKKVEEGLQSIKIENYQ